MRIPIFLLTGLLCASSASADSGTTTGKTDLREKASFDSAVLATLAAKTRVDVLQLGGGWTQVKTGVGQTGWVRLNSLQFDAAGSSANSSPSGSLMNSLANSGRTSNSGSVGSGVKGLDKEDLRRASPNYSELQKMQANAVSRDSARGFAQKSSLSQLNVAYLDQGNTGKREGN